MAEGLHGLHWTALILECHICQAEGHCKAACIATELRVKDRRTDELSLGALICQSSMSTHKACGYKHTAASSFQQKRSGGLSASKDAAPLSCTVQKLTVHALLGWQGLMKGLSSSLCAHGCACCVSSNCREQER